MKSIKRILIWSIVGIVIEAMSIIILDKLYVPALLTAKPKEVKVERTVKVEKPIEINIPDNAANIGNSYDGQYVSYYEDNSLKIVNTKDASINTVVAEKNAEIVYSRWLLDANRMLICEKDLSQNKARYFKFYYYEKGQKSPVYDIHSNVLQIALKTKNDKIQDIALAKNIAYMDIKISSGTSYDTVYRINSMAQNESNFTVSANSRIGAFNNDNDIVYEQNNNVKDKNLGWNAKNYCLLGLDDNDNVYLGTLQNGKVTKLAFGAINKRLIDWQGISFSEPTDKNNILISIEGKILVNNPEKGVITVGSTNKQISYSGKFIGITENSIVFVNQGKLETKPLD
jgi:hypothetical protein